MALSRDKWTDQLGKFQRLWEHKCAWWYALVSNPVFAPVAIGHLRTTALELEDGGILSACAALRHGLSSTHAAARVQLATAAKLLAVAAAEFDVTTKIATELLSDLDAVELGQRPEHIFELIRKLRVTLRPDGTPFRQMTDAVRREALGYTALHRELVAANLLLVYKYLKRFPIHELPMEDMVSELTIGLMRAVHGFDPRRNFRFSTYAWHWFRHTRSRVRDNDGSLIRIPVHVLETHRAAMREQSRQAPSDQPNKTFGPSALVRVLPLDAPRSSDGNQSFADMIEDPDLPDLDKTLDHANLLQQVEACLAEMTPIQRDSCRRNLGLTDETLEETGLRYNLSRERIRQIGEAMIEKVRRRIVSPRGVSFTNSGHGVRR